MNDFAKILVVDDTHLNLEILIDILSDKYDILTATDGYTALEIVKSEPIDMILLDIAMPQMNGFEVCEHLKQDTSTKDIPIIFITAETDENYIELAYNAGGVDYITKPFRVKEVLSRVSAHISISRHNAMLETLQKKLSRYLSPQIYQSIFDGKQDAKLETKRKKLTIFFSDIVNFTGTTEAMNSEDLINTLNKYLQEMSDIALSCGATIDKYIGDAIVAFFGDPESKGIKEDAVACVDMSLKMLAKLKILQTQWLEMGIEKPFRVRIGINTDYCAVGNIGTDMRMDYTIIGKAVNLASRVENVCEENSIFITEETYLLVKDVFECEEKGEVVLKGIEKPIKTYKVLSAR